MKHTYLLFLCLFVMLIFAPFVTEGAKFGLLLWYTSVVPALFPFMVLSGLLTASGGTEILMIPLHRLLAPFFPLSPNGTYVWLSGLLCGCPMGAKTCAEYIKNNRITPQEGKFLIAVCNHPSPMFLLGYAYPFFSEHIHATVFLFCIYAPVLILASISGYYYQKMDAGTSHMKADETKTKQHHVTTKSITGEFLNETILSSVTLLCKIGGYLVIFSIFIVFLRRLAMIPAAIRLFLIGIMEITIGVREVAESMPLFPAFPAVCALLSFGGLSGLFQIQSVINEKTTGLSIQSCFFWKLFHAALSFFLACLCLLCITPAESPLPLQ